MYIVCMFTQSDKKYIEEFIKNTVEPLEKQIKLLPTKDHFDERMDKLSGEIQDKREEQTLHQGQHDEIDERLDRLEKHVNLPTL